MLVYLVCIMCTEHKESNAEKIRREFMRIGRLKNTGDIVEPSIQKMTKSDLQAEESTKDKNSASPSLINESFYLKEYISMFKSTYNREEKYFYMEDYKIILKEKLFKIFNSTKEKIELSPQEFIDFLINLRGYFLYSASQDFNDKIQTSYDDCRFYKNISNILKRIVQLHCIKCEEIENDSQFKDLIRRLLSRISDDVNLKTKLNYTDLSGCVGRIDLLILLIDSKLFLKDNKGNLPLTIFDKLAQQNDFEALKKHILNNELNLERKEKEKMITENANLRERIDLKNGETTLLNQEIEKLETLLDQKSIEEEVLIAKIYWLKNQINFLTKIKEEHIEPSNKLKPSSSNIDSLNENVRKMEEELENLKEIISNFEEKQKELKSNQSMMKKDLSVLEEKNRLLKKLSSELAEMNSSSADELKRFTNIITSIDKKEATKKTKSNASTINKEEVFEVNPKF